MIDSVPVTMPEAAAELVDLIAHHQRMAGVVPALEAHDGIRAAGQPIDDLALALIAPLGANHGYVGQNDAFPVADSVS
jgi:hypothetical protein